MVLHSGVSTACMAEDLVRWDGRGKARALRDQRRSRQGGQRATVSYRPRQVNQPRAVGVTGRVLSRDGIVSSNARRHASCGEPTDALEPSPQRRRRCTVGVDDVPLAGAEETLDQAFLRAELSPG